MLGAVADVAAATAAIYSSEPSINGQFSPGSSPRSNTRGEPNSEYRVLGPQTYTPIATTIANRYTELN